MNKHRVSVVIPTFNRAELLGRALDSVLQQIDPVHEVIVVDDGSSDGTPEIVRSYMARDARVRYIRQNRAGAPAARNLGIAAASGTLIAFQDSDDVWDLNFTSSLLPYHDRPGVIAFSSMCTVQLGGSRVIQFKSQLSDVEDMLCRRNCISTQTVLMDRRLLSTHRFDPNLPRLQDWDLWLGLLGKATFVHHAEPLVHQYLQTDSITAGSDNLYRALRVITRKHWRCLMLHPALFGRYWLAARVNLMWSAFRGQSQ